MHTTVQFIRILFLASGFAAPLLNAHAEAWKINGRLTQRTVLYMHGEYDRTVTNHGTFTAVIDKCKWSFRFEPEINKAAAYDYAEAASDGTNLYFVKSIETWFRDQQSRGAQPGSKNLGSNTANAIVSSEEVPVFSTNPQLGILWLTYASACYFQTNNSGMVYTPLSHGVGRKGIVGTADHYKLRAIVKSSGGGGVPAEIVFFETNMPPVYGEALTNTVFTLGAVTNAGSVTIPLHGLTRTFAYNVVPGKAETNLVTLYEWEVNTTSIERVDGSTFVPDLHAVTHISDLRFRRDEKKPVEPFGYYGNKWLPEQEVRTFPEYKEALARAIREKGFEPAAHSRALLIVVALVLLGFPLVYLISKRRRG
jgi:hypothetical protein